MRLITIAATLLCLICIAASSFTLAFLGCTEKPHWPPDMINTALRKFYLNCNGENWPAPYKHNWAAAKDEKGMLCALDGDERKHPSPAGTRCVIGPPWHKVAPDADGGLLFLEHYSGMAEGTIPEEFKAFQMVDYIGLAGNKLKGNLWDTSRHCFLHRLDLSDNQMSGILDPHTFFTGSVNHLELLNFANNKFEGPLPATLNNLETLGAIIFNGNRFSGQIPDLSHLSKLRHLNLANNKLEGTVGVWMKELSSLSVLQLDGNVGLRGALPPLPDSITRFSASGTSFEGTIPESYGKLSFLRHFNCTGCSKLKCPKPDLLAHLLFSTHCKPRRVYTE